MSGQGRRGSDLAAYLLSPFEEDEEQVVQALVAQTAQAVEAAVEHGVEHAMNRFNQTGAPAGVR